MHVTAVIGWIEIIANYAYYRDIRAWNEGNSDMSSPAHHDFERLVCCVPIAVLFIIEKGTDA